MHARPCTEVYGDVRPCTLGHVRPCTAVYALVRRCTVEGASRGKGGGVWQHFGGFGVRVRACTGAYGDVRGCTPLYEGARWCPVRLVLATSPFPAKARVAKKGG